MSWSELFKHTWKKVIAYIFRKRGIYGRLLITLVVPSLLSELAFMSFQFDELLDVIRENYGNSLYYILWVLAHYFLGDSSYHWLSISIKLFLTILLLILEHNKTTNTPLISIGSWRKWNLSKKWFEGIYSRYYDNEIKSKYIPSLHQENEFEDEFLKPILQFDQSKEELGRVLTNSLDELNKFRKDFQLTRKLSEVEEVDFNHGVFFEQTSDLYRKSDKLKSDLNILIKFVEKKGYRSIKGFENFDADIFNLPSEFSDLYIIEDDIRELIPDPNHIVNNEMKNLKESYNGVISFLQGMNLSREIKSFRNNVLVVAGNAGAGKSHLSGHLATKIKEQGEFPIFLKASLFSGSNVHFDSMLLKLLNIPDEIGLVNVLRKMNGYAKRKNKRIYFIIDALNETTNSNLGFSRIWERNLIGFIEQIEEFSYLFLITTLRTSYISKIWNQEPFYFFKIKGFESQKITLSACKKYFEYYKIDVTNIDTADLSYFRIPLLLDLFCKMKNGERTNKISLELNLDTYASTFDEYIQKLINEIQGRLELVSQTRITEGLSNSSRAFLEENQAVLGLDSFIEAFGEDLNIREHQSISNAFLEGYLVFIKEYSNFRGQEIVKHTQQEIGGFLLAKRLLEQYGTVEELVASGVFQNQLIGKNQNDWHQLRLDILKFLIAKYPNIIVHTSHSDIIKLSWWYLYNANNDGFDLDYLSKHLMDSGISREMLDHIASVSYYRLFEPTYRYNFLFISKILNSFQLWQYELIWTANLYMFSRQLYGYMDEFLKILKDKHHDKEVAYLQARSIIYVLSTTVRELRDNATLALLEFGKVYPRQLVDLAIDFSTHPDLYIYERLVSCCYGVVMIKQNDDDFLNNNLAFLAGSFFQLQFDVNASSPVYNYIVIDSIKHIIDIAVLKGSIELNQQNYNRVSSYKFNIPYPWNNPSDEIQDMVNRNRETNPPEPIRMDFGIYTIPRLINRDKISTKVAIANVYKRISELGYQKIDFENNPDIHLREFYNGHTKFWLESKYDRLGKKYCWLAFFDYAGYLLLNKQLKVWENTEGLDEKPQYNRLSDVDIDISNPSKNSIINQKIYLNDLLKDKKDRLSTKWYTKEQFDTVIDLFNHQFDNYDYSMLYGFVEQRKDESYDVRSFLLVETMFINKDEIYKLENIGNQSFDWNHDLNLSRGLLSKAYFGELYWADTIPTFTREYENIPTGKIIDSHHVVSFRDTLYEEHKGHSVGDKISISQMEIIPCLAEPTLIEYLWESNSKLFKGYGEYVPSPNVGKALKLKSDPENGLILDENLNAAFKSVEYKDDKYFENSFSYLRSDLLHKYMNDNNLALIYQIKQHSYDTDKDHFRKLKFFIR